MRDLIERAERIGAILKARRETVAIAESSTGGLVSAALLSVGGASAYFLGGAVVYTLASRQGLLGIGELAQGMRASTEPYAQLLAERMRERTGASWALGESGATGPTGNRYGDAAGHCCLAVAGARQHSRTLETGSADRIANMNEFARAALDLLLTCLDGKAAG